MTQTIIALPFSGFYESVHSQALEDALQSLYQDDQGNPTPTHGYEKAQQSLDWHQAHQSYAKTYVKNLATSIDIQLDFEQLTSPREYNFETDRIFANISHEAVEKLYNTTDTPGLRILARERFTSRDGFISFYEPNIDDWPKDLKTWDCNQLGCLLQAYLDQEHFSSESDRFCQYQELNIMEHARCNGVLENIVWSALPPDLQPK
jgi:hypothetical protein